MKSFALSIRKRFPNLITRSVRALILKRISLLEQRTQWWKAKDPYFNDPPYSTYDPVVPVKLGIIKEFWHRHTPYIAACRDLRVPYEVVDISGPDWLDRARKSECDAFLVWPSVQLSIWKQMYDERLKVLVEDLGKVVYPSYNEL